MTLLTDGELRATSRRSAKLASREELLEVLGGGLPHFYRGRAVVFALGAARQELIDRYPCADCGAVEGRECKPDYGCLDSSRKPACPDTSADCRKPGCVHTA